MTRQDAIVFVVDDDPGFRESTERFLRSAGYRARSFASAQAFLEHPPEPGPSCALVDLRMPGMTGLDLQTELARAGRNCSLVFLTGHGAVKAAAQAMKGGAVDFLEKPYDEAVLLEAVEQALARDARLQEAERVRDDARRRLAKLTPAERQVCELLAQGMRNKEIAAALGKAESTVKAQHWLALAKLGVASAVEVAQLIARTGDDDAR